MASAHSKFTMYVQDIPPDLDQLLRYVASELEKEELESVVKSIKNTFKGKFEEQQDEDLYSCFLLFASQGLLSGKNVTLLERFVASKTSKSKEIKQRIEHFKANRQEEVLLTKEELMGRQKDLEDVMARLMGSKPAIVNLFGSGGEGKTTLGKELCQKWPGKHRIWVDLREVTEMKDVYFHTMLALETKKTIITYDESPVIEHLRTLREEERGDVLLVLDNVDNFSGGDEEAEELRTDFMAFLGRLFSKKEGKEKAQIKVLLISRRSFRSDGKRQEWKKKEQSLNEITEYKELKILEKNISMEIFQKASGITPTTEIEMEQLVEMCKRKPLLLNGMAAILRQKIVDAEKLLKAIEQGLGDAESEGETASPTTEESIDERKVWDFRTEGIDERQLSCIRKMFFLLPSDTLRYSAVAVSLFCRPFSIEAAAFVLDKDTAETVILLEGLRNSELLSADPEAKEVVYDIHPLIRSFIRSVGSGPVFKHIYLNARRRFCDLYMVKMEDIAAIMDEDFLSAFDQFDLDKPNFELALDISFNLDYLHISKKYKESIMMCYLFEAMFDASQRQKIFKSWAEVTLDDGKEGSLFRAEMKCQEALQVLDIQGWRNAVEVLNSAENSLNRVCMEYKNSELYRLARSSFLYAEGEINYKKENISIALKSLSDCLRILEEILKNHTRTTRCLNAIGNCHNFLRNFEEALKFYTRACEMRKTISSSKNHLDLPFFVGQIGTVYDGLKQYEKAIKCYEKAIELSKELKRSGIIRLALFYRNIANSYAWQNEFEKAYKLAMAAYEIRKDILGDHPHTARSAFQVGEICKSLEEFDEAEEFLDEAWQIEKSLGNANHSAVRDRIVKSYEAILQGEAKKQFQREALEFYQRFWDEEAEFTYANKSVIDEINKRLANSGDRKMIRKYEEEALKFYEEAWNSPDLQQQPDFQREDILQKILHLSKSLRKKEMHTKYQQEAIKFHERQLLEKPSMTSQDRKDLLYRLQQLAKSLGFKEKEEKYKELCEAQRLTPVEFTKALVGDQEVKPSNISKPGVFKGDDTPEMNVKPLFHTSSIPTISDTPESSLDNALLTPVGDLWSANAGSFTEQQRLAIESPRKTEKQWIAQELTTPLWMRASIDRALSSKNESSQLVTKKLGRIITRKEPSPVLSVGYFAPPRKLRDHVTGGGRASYERAGPRMPVKISPPIPLRGKEVEAKLPQRIVTYTYEPQDQEEVQDKTYEDATGSESTSYIQYRALSSKNESSQLVTENLGRIITRKGGEVSGKLFLLKIPARAVSHPVSVQVTKEDPSKYYGLILRRNLENDVRLCAPILKLQPGGCQFRKPVTLSATYVINDCRCEDFLILHGTKQRDGEITWQDLTQNASIEKTFASVRVTIEIKGFSIIAAFLRLSVIRTKDIVTRLNLLAFSYTMTALVSAQKNELALLFVSQDVYNETFYRNHESSALVQLKAQGFTEVHVRSIGKQDEKRIYNSESLQVSICLGEDYKFLNSESYNFHFVVESYVWWNTGHVIKLSLGNTRDVRILCGKISIEGQYGHRSQKHFCETDLNGYVMELMGAKGEICNFRPIAQKLMMPTGRVDQVLKPWKNEDQQLELMLQYWMNENEVLDGHQALRKDLEGLRHVCRVTQRGQMHVRHLRELAAKILGLKHENSDLAKTLKCKIQTLCKSMFRDCCIELEHHSDKIKRAASSPNHVDYLEMHGALPKDVALIYRRICSPTTGLPKSIIESFLSVVPQLIQTMKEVYVYKEILKVQNGLRGLPDKVLEQFVSDVRDAERNNKVRPLVGQMCKVLEDLCLENCGKRSTAEIERWAKGLALLSMLEFLKPFFQYCPQDIRLHTRLELFSGNLRDIMLESMDVEDEAFVRDLSDVVLSLIAFAQFDPSKLVRFELLDISGALLDCNAIENLKYDRQRDSYSQHFYIRNESDGELQVHAVACVLIDGRICKIGAFQSVVLLRPSGEPVFDKCMTRFCGVAVARKKDKDSEKFGMVLCSTQKEKLSDALDVLRGELSEDLIDFKKSVITPCHLAMRSVPGKKDAVLSLRLVYKWGSDAVSLDSSDFLPFADSTADGTWIPELQVKGLRGPDELAEEARSSLVQASGVGNTFPLDTFDTQRMRKNTVINCEKIEYHFHKTDNFMKGHVCVVGDQTTLNDQSSSQRYKLLA